MSVKPIFYGNGMVVSFPANLIPIAKTLGFVCRCLYVPSVDSIVASSPEDIEESCH